MKLSKITILALKGMTKEHKGRLAESMGMSTNSFYRHINENQDNGELTKAKALQVISEETGLDQSQILEDTEKINEEITNGATNIGS